MPKISTHILDTSSGKPASGVRVRIFQGEKILKETLTNSDGRTDQPLLEDPAPGTYEILFSIGDYFRAEGTESPFLEEIPIRFSTLPGESYHVPLLCTPWSYSTYRGS
ncbi:MAG: hydroxyisourate hydrolase [Luteolibacter sp.]